MSNTIHTSSFETFMQAIAALVRDGLTFEADADSLTITLTGGF